jgi:TPR repeat protein
MPKKFLCRLAMLSLLALSSGLAGAADQERTLGAPSLGLKSVDADDEGALVTHVSGKGPADVGGLRRGDVIVGVDGAPIRTHDDFLGALASLTPGKAAVLAVRRGKDTRSITVIPERAVPLYTRLCDGGDPLACGTIGWMLSRGSRVPPDPARAEGLLTRACDGRDFPSCVNLGNLFERGVEGTPEPTRAAQAYEKACEGGILEGCIDLARLLQSGRGVPPDVPRALRLYERACDAGDVEVCTVLANVYTHGFGVPADAARARGFLERACALGSRGACAAVRD